MKLSVVLPTYNEAGNIVPLVQRILEEIPADWQPEVIVMDDDSPDGTYAVAREAFQDTDAVVVRRRDGNRGLAASIRDGIDIATGDKIAVMDTDFTHDPREIPKMLHVSGAYDMIVGSRFCAGGNMQDTAHFLASHYYNRMIRVLLRTQVQDNLGGYFLMRTSDLRSLPLDDIFYGYGDYFFRLLHHVQLANLSIVEVPAIYRERVSGASKSRFSHLLISYTREVVRLIRPVRKHRRERRQALRAMGTDLIGSPDRKPD